jgi:hypothetical protein
MTPIHGVERASDPKWNFLEGVFLSNSRRDAFMIRKGRKVYAPRVRDETRVAVENAVCSRLRELLPVYRSPVSEEIHIKNIRSLADGVSDACATALNEGRLVFGVAQKLVNSWLKYLWCAGQIQEPPHCPFDRIIIGKLKLPPDCGMQWTRGSEADYRSWISAAKVLASQKNKSLAVWELHEWAA